MSTYTATFSLAKPAYEDWADIATLNTNMDIIDEKVQPKLIAGSKVIISGSTINVTVPSVAVSESGTATASVNYITVDGVEYKIGGSGGGGGSSVIISTEINSSSTNSTVPGTLATYNFVTNQINTAIYSVSENLTTLSNLIGSVPT